jgi:hypothetical protein
MDALVARARRWPGPYKVVPAHTTQGHKTSPYAVVVGGEGFNVVGWLLEWEDAEAVVEALYAA